jgi:hypothetical protein
VAAGSSRGFPLGRALLAAAAAAAAASSAGSLGGAAAAASGSMAKPLRVTAKTTGGGTAGVGAGHCDTFVPYCCLHDAYKHCMLAHWRWPWTLMYSCKLPAFVFTPRRITHACLCAYDFSYFGYMLFNICIAVLPCCCR